MKLSFIIAAAALSAEALASTLTAPPVSTVTEEAAPTYKLAKRARKAIVNPEYAKLQAQKSAIAAGKTIGTTSETPKAWQRTIYSTVVEIVYPTVIAGVTFSGKPPATTDGLEPWVSLKKDGSPKTIKPKLKNGRIENGSPTYGTYFATATTVRYDHAQLKAHNMAEDEVYEEEIHIDEDDTYQRLNPLIRCVPDRYFKKGTAKNIPSEPFCTPQEHSKLKVDQTYFVTWYSKFFDESVENVKIHYSIIKEAARMKGFKKRSEAIEAGGSIQKASIASTEWISKDQGYVPVTILKEWLGEKDYHKKMAISIQPDNVSDEDFDLLDKFVVVEIAMGATVSKGTNLDLKKQEEKLKNAHLGVEIEDGADLEKYYVMMAMPTCVMIAALLMYLFVYVNSKGTDLSGLKKRRAAGKNTTHRRLFWKGKKSDGYSTLPQHSKDIELENVGKKD